MGFRVLAQCPEVKWETQSGPPVQWNKNLIGECWIVIGYRPTCYAEIMDRLYFKTCKVSLECGVVPIKTCPFLIELQPSSIAASCKKPTERFGIP